MAQVSVDDGEPRPNGEPRPGPMGGRAAEPTLCYWVGVIGWVNFSGNFVNSLQNRLNLEKVDSPTQALRVGSAELTLIEEPHV